ESLGVQGTLLVEQGSASRSLPSLLAIRIATLHGMHYSAHSSLLLPKLMPCAKGLAKDGEGAPSFQYLSVLRLAFARSLSFRDGRRRDRSRRTSRTSHQIWANNPNITPEDLAYCCYKAPVNDGMLLRQSWSYRYGNQ